MQIEAARIQQIVSDAWEAGASSALRSLEDLSPGVSSNYVYRLALEDGRAVIAKWSCFGTYQHFVEDHHIIHQMNQLLEPRYQNFLSRSVLLDGQPYIHYSQTLKMDSWVAFYEPINVLAQLPKKLPMEMVKRMGEELAYFHLACTEVSPLLPRSTKTTRSDILELVRLLENDSHSSAGLQKMLLNQCARFLDFNQSVNAAAINSIPVFIDWNIGNFSVDASGAFYSRWDYDWFRMSTRMLDFYFFSRVVGEAGDRTDFTYEIDVLLEDRFIYFLQSYHAIFPLQYFEVKLLPELYRFFLLNYVIKFGRTFFRDYFADRLEHDVLHTHFSSVDTFDTGKLLDALF